MGLIERLREQDEAAMKEVMELYGDYLIKTAFLLIKDRQMAEEAVQDTFLTLFHKIDQLKEPEKLRSWLTTIVINQCRKRMRKWSFKHIFPIHEDVFKFVRDEDAPDPEKQLLRLSRNQNLSEKVQLLDYSYREAIILYYFNEMKISEIAVHTRSKESTVKSRLKRGRALLKKLMEEGRDSHGR